MVCNRCEGSVHILATGGMSVNVGHILAIGVTPVSLEPLITFGNLGVWSWLDIV
jgi:hypothetical protein